VDFNLRMDWARGSGTGLGLAATPQKASCYLHAQVLSAQGGIMSSPKTSARMNTMQDLTSRRLWPEENEDSPTKRLKTSHGSPAVPYELGTMRHGESGAFVGSASGIHFIQSVYGTVSANTANETLSQHLVPGEDDVLASPKSIWQAHELNDPYHNPAGEKFTFDDMVMWSSSYFDLWHPAWPALHAPSVLAVFESMANDQAVDIWDMIVTRSIMSVSLADRRQSRTVRPIPKHLIFESFDAALESIQPALVRPATIASLQSAVAVQIFLVSMLRLNGASRLGGLIVRMLYQLGLYRCPTRYPSFSTEECALRRRLFQTIYCLERHIGHAIGTPLTLSDSDIDVCTFGDERHGAQAPMDARLQLLTFLTKNARIRGSIIELRNKNVRSRDPNTDAAVMINTRLKSWWNEVSDALDHDTLDTEPTPTPNDVPSSAQPHISHLHQSILQVLRHECTITLNRPLLASPKDSAAYASGLQSCITAAKAILATLHALEAPLFWPSLTWATWMSSFIVIFAAWEGNIAAPVALRLTARAVKIFQRLAMRGSVWPGGCALAIENLRRKLEERTARGNGDEETPAAVTTWPTGEESAARGAAVQGSTAEQTWSAATRFAQTPAASSLPLGNLQDQGNTSWPDASLLPKDIPPYSFDALDPLQGFDIPFWVNQDTFSAWAGDI
jgi:hypothetical protein